MVGKSVSLLALCDYDGPGFDANSLLGGFWGSRVLERNMRANCSSVSVAVRDKAHHGRVHRT